MNLLKKIKSFFMKQDQQQLLERLERVERGYIILLKRVLEMDGVELGAKKISKFSNTVLQTPKEELNKGLNEPKPTIH